MAEYSSNADLFQGQTDTELHEASSESHACDVPLAVSFFADVKAQRIESRNLSLRQLQTRLHETTAPDKSSLPLMKLATFGDERTEKGNSLRHDANLVSVSGVEGDYDAGAITPQDAAERLRQADISALIYTTPNHMPEAPRFRVLAPLARDVSPAEREALCARLNGALGGILAAESFTPSQSFYFGSVTTRPLESILVEGQTLDRVTGVPSIGPKVKDLALTTELTDLFREPADRQMIKDALDSIKLTDGGDRHTWRDIGMALHQEYRGSSEGFDLFHNWSKSQPRYKGRKDVRSTWNSFTLDKPGGIRIGTLFEIARQRSAYEADDFDDLTDTPTLICDCADKSTCLCDLLGIPKITQRRNGNLEWFIDADMPKSAPYIVKDVLDQGASSVMYGPSNAGKTFVALDLVYRLASAKEDDNWCGKRVTRTAVLYCALEGGNGFKKRLLALRGKHGGADIPLAYRCAGANLLAKDDKGDVKTIAKMAKEIQLDRRAAGLPMMIVIDTLSRALAGGNENGPEDMTAFIANVDRIRAETGAHVMIIHHTGKDTAKGMRGHSSLIAAIDSELEVARPDNGRIVTLHVGKQRDAMSDYDLAAGTLETVTIGEGDDGETIESAVVQWGAAFPGKQTNGVKHPTGRTAIALQILDGLPQPLSKQDWKASCVASDAFCASDKPDTRRTAFTRAVQELLRGKWVSDENGGFSICDAFDLPGQTRTNSDMSETSNPANRQPNRTDTDTTL